MLDLECPPPDHTQTGAEQGDRRADERRRAAVIAFAGAAMPSPPSTALLVAALAGARRAVAMHQVRGLVIDQWLAREVRLHPDRAGVLDDLLAVLD